MKICKKCGIELLDIGWHQATHISAFLGYKSKPKLSLCEKCSGGMHCPEMGEFVDEEFCKLHEDGLEKRKESSLPLGPMCKGDRRCRAVN